MLGFAFLLPFLTWIQAAGMALMALLFNLFILPRMQVDLSKPLAAVGERGESAGDVWTGIILYPLSVLALILVYRRHMHIVAAVWAIMALGDGMAGVAGAALKSRALPWRGDKTWAGFAAFVLAGTLGSFVLACFVDPTLAAARVFWTCIATAIVGAVVETLPIRLDDNASVPLVCGAFMFCAFMVESAALASNLPYLGRRLALGGASCLAFALVARALKLVNNSGAVAGTLFALAVYMGYGFKSFLILLSFFVLGSVATRLGFAKKATRGIAERRGGARSWREAVANTLAGAFFALLAISTNHQAAFLAALVAAFAEAAGDTVSSEIGQWLSGRAYLITTFEPVAAGENGGVTLVGTAAGLVASALVAGLGLALGLVGKGGAGWAFGAAIAGNLLDSLLGATIERRHGLTNGTVNFAGTSFAGALALAFSLRA